MLLNYANNGRVLVVGDAMVDRYVHGSASRLSPEAPVPVLTWMRDQRVAGGAANVAANIAALGGTVGLASVVGDDDGAQNLDEALADFRDRLDLLFVVDPGRPTTLKTRFVTNGQQLLRLDREDTGDIGPASEADLLARIEADLPRADVVVLSDYRKGVLTNAVIRRVIDVCRATGRRVIVDPKRADWTVYRGASVITPNKAELRDATGLPCDTDVEVEAAARCAWEATGAAILVTRSERGMSLVEGDEPAFHIPTHAREVFDVSGAGDTVVAVLAASLAAGLTLRGAMGVANVAGGLVIAKHGTATLSVGELNRALKAAEPRQDGIASTGQVLQLRETWRRQGLTVGFTNGCFDIIHPGHIQLFEQAAARCDRLIVAINSDASVKRLKGPTRPIQDEASRAKVIGALFCVDTVVIFEEDTPYELIGALKPDVLVKGADYREEDVVGGDVVKAAGGIVVLATLRDGQSTTAILARSNDRT